MPMLLLGCWACRRPRGLKTNLWSIRRSVSSRAESVLGLFVVLACFGQKIGQSKKEEASAPIFISCFCGMRLIRSLSLSLSFSSQSCGYSNQSTVTFSWDKILLRPDRKKFFLGCHKLIEFLSAIFVLHVKILVQWLEEEGTHDCEFESLHLIVDGFFIFICYKIVSLMWKHWVRTS